MLCIRFALLMSFSWQYCLCANILCVAPVPSYSHQIFYRGVWLELAKRGHNITLLTTDPIPEPPKNIRQIDWSPAYKIRHVKHDLTNRLQKNRKSLGNTINTYIDFMKDLLIYEFSHPDVQKLLNDHDEHFDLVITEYMLSPPYYLAHRFQCPFIGITSGDLPGYAHQILGNFHHPLQYPDMFSPKSGSSSFFNRLLNVFVHLKLSYWDGAGIEQKLHDTVTTKFFGKDIPHSTEMNKNVSMVFANNHPVFSARPLGPKVHYIGGGSHMQPIKPLPTDIQDFLDSANNGAIYFSLGTNVKSNNLTPELIRTFISAFRSLKYKVLWKFEVDVEDLPENVKIVRWTPQQDVLRHKNIKLFIFQCGLQSMEEAITSEVPMIGIPFVSDQDKNAATIVAKGMGVVLDKRSISEDMLNHAVKEVIENPKYKTTVVAISKLLKDNPMNGLEKVVWYAEYVIRNKDYLHHLEKNVPLPFYQYYFLDIELFLACFLTVFVVAMYKIFFFIIFILRKIYSVVLKNKLVVNIKKD